MSNVAYLGEHDRIDRHVKEFNKVREVLVNAVRAMGGTGYLCVNVPNLRARTFAKGRRSLKGPAPDGQRRLTEINEEIIASQHFSPELGLDILSYLAIEEHNANVEAKKLKGPKLEHKTVLLNDGHTRVTPFDFGSADFFNKLALKEQVNRQSPFMPMATMAKVEGMNSGYTPVTAETKAMIAAQINAKLGHKTEKALA